MSVAPGGTAQSKPVVRLSSTTCSLLLSGLEEGVNPVAADVDVAGAAGDQDGVVSRIFRTFDQAAAAPVW